ncbi:hypothetical protein EVE76_15165 (plasmid) [Lactiplantibacillus plantarum]|uniref:hypothetical protein n=1 Tax=Lactiplantibacillus plantarum TaxID=1590 RepID=UPI001019BB14|nr:hypothetical protein [Lactiplantibacillus plantarum]QBA72722.1 hypothetical protein EVE76_15165 [Lactiplantibacillus plantarum]
MMLFELERAINSGVYYLVRNVQTGTTRVRLTGCPTLADYDEQDRHDSGTEMFGASSFETINYIKPYKRGIQYCLVEQVPGTKQARILRKLYGFSNEGE